MSIHIVLARLLIQVIKENGDIDSESERERGGESERDIERERGREREREREREVGREKRKHSIASYISGLISFIEFT